MNKEKEEILDHNKKEKDSTNWTAWYVILIGFLLVQILVYYWITNSFDQ